MQAALTAVSVQKKKKKTYSTLMGVVNFSGMGYCCGSAYISHTASLHRLD
jgi:hypothetical protein